MCTLALYFQVSNRFPIVVAANRDEHYDRPSSAPALTVNPVKIVSGSDLRAGGTWLGVNEFGMLVGVLNRRNSGELHPAQEVRSRGLLCRDLLKLRSADSAEDYLAKHDAFYSPFIVVFADRKSACVAYNTTTSIFREPLDAGLHVFSSAGEVDYRSAKAAAAEQEFAPISSCIGAPALEPGDWTAALKMALSNHRRCSAEEPADSICVHRESSGTVSSTIIYFGAAESQFKTLYCDGTPCKNDFAPAPALDVDDGINN